MALAEFHGRTSQGLAKASSAHAYVCASGARPAKGGGSRPRCCRLVRDGTVIGHARNCVEWLGLKHAVIFRTSIGT